ncbi:MAG: DNA polymerase III subunit alpha [Bacteroidetes bacterium]|nr:DNA polymerase III subunit alpha [Bacteroidota bacterium]
MDKFSHLHCHTQYSLLDGAAKIASLIDQTKQLGMEAIAITDHGNMFGVPHFVNQANKAGVKPIIGCEFYVAEDMHDRKNKKRYHQVLLAKNEIGYKNISKLCSLGFTEGYYYKPRIDKTTIKKYSEGIIATTCCLGSEINQAILAKGEAEAEKIFLQWLDIFGEDYYIELQRHNFEDMDKCCEILMKWSKKYNVKAIATNDVHYIKQEDSIAQDVLLCLQTGKDYDDPNRMRFLNDQFYLKSPQEMSSLFKDLPEAITNTQEIISKIETPSLTRDILMPIFQIPQGIKTQDEYLKKLTYEGAKRIYGSISPDLEQRLNYELGTLESMGFAGYFLIVQDFVAAARKTGVIVGPGRGSVAGSLVAYCLGITDVDPIKYNLFFERFLNPERVSMPDIDIDFDDEGRQKVIDYVIDKYGKNQVAQIITFGSMAAKSSIRDVSRVLGVPLEKADHMAKLVPEKPGTSLAKAFKEIPELAEFKKKIETPEGKVLALAETLEGSARHTGIHAAGIIIAPDDITNYLPVKIDKDSDLLVTQYDGSIVESVGMLKMDFLGLKTLSIIKDALKLIEKNYSKKINIKEIPLNDEKTFMLFQKGNTIGTFQFESEGMRSWLPKLKPTEIEDLIAMNALYRPGPMQFIPNFIDRKYGREKVEYPHKLLEDILKNTYGIMVYQEQIMQTAQIIAGYTLGQADILRRAMGKKKVEEMEKQKAVFIKGAKETNDINEKIALEIFSMMEKFAQYGFNRAHSAAYSIVAYQTAYLKANYPAEFMASVLTHNQNDISKISYFMDECKKQGIKVLGPHINESSTHFDVSTDKNDLHIIRFGLAAIKGSGDAAVSAIIEERNDNGIYKDIFDFIERINLRKVNKKTMESLCKGGAFDDFEFHRRQYLQEDPNGNIYIEKLIQYGNKIKEEKNSMQQSLFASTPDSNYNSIPKPEEHELYSNLEKLKMEKDVVGFYISGHPLDYFKFESKYICTANTKNYLDKKNKEARIAGIITESNIRQTKRGQTFCAFSLEDFYGSINMALFGEDFRKNQHLIHKGEFVYISGIVQERYKNPGMWEFRPKLIEQLHGLREKKVKELTINLTAENLETIYVDNIFESITKNPGNVPIRLKIKSEKEKHIFTEGLIKKYRINPSNEFFSKLDENTQILYDVEIY